MAFGWCTCPYCPVNARSSPHTIPHYGNAGHQHSICEWCSVWQRLGGGYELESFYRCYADAFEEIHDFFRGASTPPRAVAYEIRRIASWIDENADRGYRDMAWIELARDLWRLVNQVGMGHARDARYYSRHAGGGPWYRSDRGLGWR